jgi:hypothetical protein
VSPRSRPSVPAGARSRAAAACGLLAVALAVAVPVLGGAAEPGYSHRAQFISELGAAGAAHAALVSKLGFAPIGVLVLAFLALAAPRLPAGRRTAAGLVAFSAVGAAYLAAAAFPCDAGCPAAGSLSQSIHNAFGFLEYAGGVAGLLLLGAAFRGSARWRPVAPVCAACALLAAAGLVAMLVPSLAPSRGLSQRLAEAAVFGWIATVAASLWSAPATQPVE